MKFIPLILFLFIIPLTTATTNFKCPDSINVNEEFVCSLEISDLEGIWDVKVELVNNGKTIAKIWNGENFTSAYYYLKEFMGIDEKKDIKLIISEVGDLEGSLKLRQGSKKDSTNFKIEVLGSNEIPKEESKAPEVEKNLKEEKNDDVVILDSPKKSETISLNAPTGNVVEDTFDGEELIYESKNAKILKYSPYAFSLFLIFIIGVLLREKF